MLYYTVTNEIPDSSFEDANFRVIVPLEGLKLLRSQPKVQIYTREEAVKCLAERRSWAIEPGFLSHTMLRLQLNSTAKVTLKSKIKYVQGNHITGVGFAGDDLEFCFHGLGGLLRVIRGSINEMRNNSPTKLPISETELKTAYETALSHFKAGKRDALFLFIKQNAQALCQQLVNEIPNFFTPPDSVGMAAFIGFKVSKFFDQHYPNILTDLTDVRVFLSTEAEQMTGPEVECLHQVEKNNALLMLITAAAFSCNKIGSLHTNHPGKITAHIGTSDPKYTVSAPNPKFSVFEKLYNVLVTGDPKQVPQREHKPSPPLPMKPMGK